MYRSNAINLFGVREKSCLVPDPKFRVSVQALFYISSIFTLENNIYIIFMAGYAFEETPDYFYIVAISQG